MLYENSPRIVVRKNGAYAVPSEQALSMLAVREMCVPASVYDTTHDWSRLIAYIDYCGPKSNEVEAKRVVRGSTYAGLAGRSTMKTF